MTKFKKALATLMTVACTASALCVPMSVSANSITANYAQTDFIQNSQVGTYTNVSTSTTNNDSSAIINITQDLVYLYNVYIDGRKVRAIIEDGGSNAFAVADGYVSITLNEYQYYNNGSWTTSHTKISEIGEANVSIHLGDIKWTFIIGNQEFFED